MYDFVILGPLGAIHFPTHTHVRCGLLAEIHAFQPDRGVRLESVQSVEVAVARVRRGRPPGGGTTLPEGQSLCRVWQILVYYKPNQAGCFTIILYIVLHGCSRDVVRRDPT